MILRRFGIGMERVYLVTKDDEKASVGGFLDADEALRMLRRAAADYDNLQHFRTVWRDDLNTGAGGIPPSDRKVLTYLAERLASGVLKVAAKNRRDPNVERKHTGGSGAAPPPPVPSAPPPPKEPPLKLRAPSLPKLPKLPDIVPDVAGQIDALLKAAEDGLAFVEQCAKL
jgi:hypothetical protein